MNETQETERFLVFENYQHTLSENIINYLNKKVFVNITLVCKGENIRAHQIILSACSPFFENILIDQKQPHPVIIFTDIAKNEMEILLQYMYAGRVSVPNDLVPSVLKAAKILQLRGLNYDEFDHLQSASREDPVDVSNVTPNLSAISTQPNAPNVDFGAAATDHNNSLPVVPETNAELWLTAAHNSDKQKDHSKKVLNPFAKKLNSSSDSDSTVFDDDETVLSSSRNSPKKKSEKVMATSSPLSNDSDVEFIDVNPVVVIPDSQCADDSKLCRTEKRRSSSTCSDEFSEIDQSEILPTSSKKLKIEKIDNIGASPKVKVNPVALKNRSRDILNEPTTSKSKYFSVSNSHGNEDGIQKKSDKHGDLDRGKANQLNDKSEKNQNRDEAVPGNSKQKGIQPNENKKTKEPFEGFTQMSLRNLRNFCVICEKRYRHIKEHVKREHAVPPRGKKFICKVCSKKFSFQDSLTFHNCK